VYGSGYNRIYHNNLINNYQHQALDDNYFNYWHNGYPSGGNYWSDYVTVYGGADEFKGENQDILGSDGVGDTPYYFFYSRKDRYPLMKPVVGGLVSHPPIYIEGNDDLTPANGVASGSGTENDPYIIEGWDINAENAYGIWIKNTTAHFIIRNCYVHDGICFNYGILLESVTNGKIDNLKSYNNRSIVFVASSNIVITNSVVEGIAEDGIRLYYSSNNYLLNNA
jgi:parallel beta-helix repeat protein